MPDANLSKGIRQLNSVYTQQFNRRQRRVGHVFQGRYKAIHVEKESYILELIYYIVLNPVREIMVHQAIEWPWSSYRGTISKEKTLHWLNFEWLLAAFAVRKSMAIKRYKLFIEVGQNQSKSWEELSNQLFLRSNSFVTKIKKLKAAVLSSYKLSNLPIMINLI